MARPPTGQIVERAGKNGRVFALRFRAYGERRYITTEAQSRKEAEQELRHVLADVERGVWRPAVPASVPSVVPAAEPSFWTSPGSGWSGASMRLRGEPSSIGSGRSIPICVTTSAESCCPKSRRRPLTATSRRSCGRSGPCRPARSTRA